MKALCLKQPYASWVADGSKIIETRTWKTSYRGKFLVVASRSIDLLQELELPIENFPLGRALCIAKLAHCRPMTEQDEREACCERYEGAWAWILSAVWKIKSFPVKGQLRFFEVEYGEDV